MKLNCARCKNKWWCVCNEMMKAHRTTVINNFCLCCYERQRVIKVLQRPPIKDSTRKKMKKQAEELLEKYKTLMSDNKHNCGFK